MVNWLGPIVSGVFELAAQAIPVRRIDLGLQNAPLWKRLVALLLIIAIGSISAIPLTYLVFLGIGALARLILAIT